MVLICENVFNGYRFELIGTLTLDSNILNIYNDGRLVYSNYNIYDIDVMRIWRALYDIESLYHKKSIKSIIEYLNEKSIYLYININEIKGERI